MQAVRYDLPLFMTVPLFPYSPQHSMAASSHGTNRYTVVLRCQRNDDTMDRTRYGPRTLGGNRSTQTTRSVQYEHVVS